MKILLKLQPLIESSVLTLLLTLNVNAYAEDSSEDLLNDFSLEDLMDIEVTSVSRKAQKLSDTAAAVFVITNEDIKRSGVTSIPEALRMAPGINVNRIDSSKWAITSRGFNDRYANKLLVMIDGRSVYDPNFSGTYWESRDVFLEDVERIEVIRGPGGTLWGANAVNGVINIITKHSAETQGGFVEAGAGTEEKGFVGARYGAELSEGTFARAYVKAFDRDESKRASGEGSADNWKALRVGFRIDSQYNERNSLTFQGDLFNGDQDNQLNITSNVAPFQEIVDDTAKTGGGNILGRWNHITDSSSEFTFQFYYDRYDRSEIHIDTERDTFDLDFQHRFAPGKNHDILWGASYRLTNDKITNTSSIQYSDTSPTENGYGLFVQDEITLARDRLWLTLGTKFQHSNLYSIGLQPSARILWIPHQQHRFWASVSRAERSPSLSERYMHSLAAVIPIPTPLPTILTVSGQTSFKPEKMTAWELGYRVSLTSSLSIDATIFHNKYTELGSLIASAPEFKGTYLEVPYLYNNLDEAKTWGFEVASSWQASEWWGLDLAYSYLRKDITSPVTETLSVDNHEPRHRASFRSNMDLSENLDLDLWLKYTSSHKLPAIPLPGTVAPENYLTLDLRLGWMPADNLTIELVGQNLLDSQHLEHQSRNFVLRSEIERSIYGQISWKF